MPKPHHARHPVKQLLPYTSPSSLDSILLSIYEFEYFRYFV
jgi:hypothetical protein